MKFNLLFLLLSSLIFPNRKEPPQAWIRVNLVGYLPASVKIAVWCSKVQGELSEFDVVNEATGTTLKTLPAGRSYGAYGPFLQTYRLDFSSVKATGKFFLRVGEIRSPTFYIDEEVYRGAADFCLNYLRQQRSGYNPYLKDSCHTHDGYTLYGPMRDSTHVDVVGGWHDASDYLQYATTSANATFHLLMAYRDFPQAFGDRKERNGLDGKNGYADVLDEARWGLDWLLKMHPSETWMFNQVADDRDHINMRMPGQDSQYGRGYERPVYFVSGQPQQRGKFMNRTTGTSSTAAKFSSAFSLGSRLLAKQDPYYSELLKAKALSSYQFANRKRGVTQTASVRSPYIYAEENWVDDMELAASNLASVISDQGDLVRLAQQYANQEPVTPWLGKDTAGHYQWYPFINLGHYELGRLLDGAKRDTITGYYREGIERVWNKAKSNAFYRGIPYIWCSNNLTTAFAIQCYWYRQLTHDRAFANLEQANVDWILGCNPWGTSMIYGFPSYGDTPSDPHSAFTHLKSYPIDGALVDGPVYTSIYKGLIGISLNHEDTYAAFQSDLAVYHDDYGDYSTNEPTMDGTASLVYLLGAMDNQSRPSVLPADEAMDHGAIVRGDTTKKEVALVFTGDQFADGADVIRNTLKEHQVKASFFLTGNFYRNPSFQSVIKKLNKEGHYLGAHSDRHLLYCDWNNRDHLLVTRAEFQEDLRLNYKAMDRFHPEIPEARYFLPPYEWHNDSIASWTQEMGLELINYSPGTLSHADYTTPEDPAYQSSEAIFQSIVNKESKEGLNGFILLMHIGTDSHRTDKFYNSLGKLIDYLKKKGYRMVRIDELLD